MELSSFGTICLGRPLILYTDHKPLESLSAQKKEGLLCHWALALHEYKFKIVYGKCTKNNNADALSRREQCALTFVGTSYLDIHEAQLQDPVISVMIKCLQSQRRRHRQTLWHQTYNR
jgi:hypothetical protein